MIEVYRLSIVLFFTASVVVAQPHLGAGCTTAYFIDADCDGYGVGKKSSGIYPLGLNGNVLGSPLIATAGDLPDADDQDATVHTTAQWQAKWGSNSAGMANFLATRKGFTNTSRIYYLALNGNDSTGVVNDPAHPFRTMAPLLTIFHDLQGGVIIIRGGNWTDLDIGPCGNSGQNPCYALTGSAAKPAYVMAYPGETVKATGLTHIIYNDLSYWPQLNARYVTFDGLILAATQWGIGDGVSFIDTDHMTLRNCEFLGWHQLWIGNHSEDNTFEFNVFHDFMYHCIYNGFYPGNFNPYGNADFDFTDDAARYIAGTSPGASARTSVLNNVMYNNGYSGYEPVHLNTYLNGANVEGNILSYGSGGIGLQTGVYNALIRNNLLFDAGRSAITLSLYGDTVLPATIRYITIENNTIWAGNTSDSILNTSPYGAIQIGDASTATGRWIKDVTIRNNLLMTSNSDATYGAPMFAFFRNSYPSTYTIDHNLVWGTGSSPATGNNIMAISTDPYGAGATKYTWTQFQAFASGRFASNTHADPKITAASQNYTTSIGSFDFGLQTGSPAIGAGSATGAPAMDISGTARTGHVDIGAYQFAVASAPAPSACDLNGDGAVDVRDVSILISQVLAQAPCTFGSGTCDVTSVQRVINAALGGVCIAQ